MRQIMVNAVCVAALSTVPWASQTAPAHPDIIQAFDEVPTRVPVGTGSIISRHVVFEVCQDAAWRAVEFECGLGIANRM